MRDPVKAKIRRDRWAKANPEKVIAARKAWDEANPGKTDLAIKDWKKSNTEKINGYAREAYKRDPDKYKDLSRKIATGWTRGEFDDAWRKQDGKCWICLRSLSRDGKINKAVACADHNHVTKRKRGLLCAHCNRLEGQLINLNIPIEEWFERLCLYYITFDSGD